MAVTIPKSKSDPFGSVLNVNPPDLQQSKEPKEETAPYLLHMPVDLHRDTKTIAASQGMTIRDYILKALREALKQPIA